MRKVSERELELILLRNGFSVKKIPEGRWKVILPLPSFCFGMSPLAIDVDNIINGILEATSDCDLSSFLIAWTEEAAASHLPISISTIRQNAMITMNAIHGIRREMYCLRSEKAVIVSSVYAERAVSRSELEDILSLHGIAIGEDNIMRMRVSLGGSLCLGDVSTTPLSDIAEHLVRFDALQWANALMRRKLAGEDVGGSYDDILRHGEYLRKDCLNAAVAIIGLRLED